jgi:hypothetical protein
VTAPIRIPYLQGELVVSAPIVDPSLPRGVRTQPDWLGESGMTCTAEFLAGHGLPLPIMAPMRGLLVELLPAG